MANERRRSLPLLGPDEAAPSAQPERPTVEHARRKLGGRGASGPGQGRIVTLAASGGSRMLGVIVFAAEDELDVLVDGSTVRRARAETALPHAGDVPEQLSRLAADVQVFSRIAEGDRVRYEARAGVMGEGRLVEKCRYGGLVLTETGVVVAVGFRKLWPAAPPTLGSPRRGGKSGAPS